MLLGPPGRSQNLRLQRFFQPFQPAIRGPYRCHNEKSRPFDTQRSRGLREQRLRIQPVCASVPQRTASFPAGRRQARVQLPASFLTVKASEVLTSTEVLSAGLSAGATGVILEDDSGSGGAELYEAAVKLKDLIRGRAVLLISDRTDIANAVEADGVSLTSKGVPVLVGRRMLSAKDGLVGRVVSSPEEAREAAAAGANLIVLQDASGSASSEAISQAKKGQKGDGGIPVIVTVSSASQAKSIAKFGADGTNLKAASLTQQNASSEVIETLRALSQQSVEPSSSGSTPKDPVQTGDGKLKHFLDSSKEKLLEEERTFLQEALDFLQEAAPDMQEIGLLRDAIKQLDELFLVVVVGEFNSGKSTIINALLGSRYLADGILPTTNEIAVLKFSENGSEEMTQTSDGLYVRKLPAELLKDINIVDTPGTNVIVDRQQRLTEEYVPRADIVLFCISADRPFTESETKFLKYIRQWGKKIVFVLNKVDILSSDQEIDEVSNFVADSAKRMLGVDSNKILPVSARSALDVKLRLGGGSMAGTIISDADKQALEGDSKWKASRFGPLEQFILDFLIGGASAGESVRLKLQTPLFVADALLDAGRQQLDEDLQAAQEDVATIERVQAQLAKFRKEMSQDGQAQRRQARKTISNATKAAQGLVESTLQLSNFDGLSGYIFGSKGKEGIAGQFQKQVSKPFSKDLESIVEEHTSWLESNCERQLGNYRKFTEQRAADMNVSSPTTGNGSSSSIQSSSASSAEERRRWRESRLAKQDEDSTAVATQSDADTSMQVLRNFDPNSGAVILEEEVREAVIKTAGAAVGAAGLGVFSTFILPTTLEDFLGLGIGGVVGYAALLNLPLRRNDAKEKLQRVATNFAEDLDKMMEQELSFALDKCIAGINEFVQPLQREAEAIVTRVEASQKQLASISDTLRRLQQRAANVE